MGTGGSVGRESGAGILLVWVLLNLFGIMFEMKKTTCNQVSPAWEVELTYTLGNI